MPTLRETVRCLSEALLGLDPGPLAELRRMDPDGAGPPAYWGLAGKCGFLDRNPADWMRVVCLMALLAPKGERQTGDRLHDGGRPLGLTLCDGGVSDWPRDGESPRPFLSERRLARLLVLRGEQRGPALERVVRMLAASRDRGQGLDCVALAALVLMEPDAKTLRRLAQDYYRRLDAAQRKHEAKEPA